MLEVDDLVKHFPILGGLLQRRVGEVRAVDGVSFAIAKGETLGLVGESGCGKSTIGKTVLKLIEPTAGRILLGGEDVTELKPGAMWPHRQRIQTIFQDPYSSMNPRLPAGTIVGEPLENFGIARGAETRRARRAPVRARRPAARRHAQVRRTNSPAASASGWASPRRSSVNPDVIVADEPVSALDVSVQAQVLNLLIDLQEEYGLAYLFISHDLAVMRHISHRIAVMYLGRIVELTDQAHAVHPARCTPTPRRCCRRRRRPIPSGAQAQARSCRATCRARPIRRPAATSTPAAPTRWPNAR